MLELGNAYQLLSSLGRLGSILQITAFPHFAHFLFQIACILLFCSEVPQPTAPCTFLFPWLLSMLAFYMCATRGSQTCSPRSLQRALTEPGRNAAGFKHAKCPALRLACRACSVLVGMGGRQVG